jgi:bifunctional non-homologous end joining protein LigD
VEDHPVDYITFSGTIPEGQYGAGTVEIWDQGSFTLEKKTEKEIEFMLKGQKLQGGFVLVHTNGQNWLFLKRKNS